MTRASVYNKNKTRRIRHIGGGRGQWFGAPWGSGGKAPSRVQGQSLGVRGRSPPEAESILVIGCPTEPANLAPVREKSMFCYGPLVSVLGVPRVHGAPNPVIGGGGGAPRPPAPPPMHTVLRICPLRLIRHRSTLQNADLFHLTKKTAWQTAVVTLYVCESR